jgi:hypothetical protein
MNELSPDALIATSFGYVVFGYLLIFPFWAAGKIWNRALRDRQINPWTAPLAVLVFIFACFLSQSQGFRFATLEDEIVLLGLIPGTVGCFVARRRYRRVTGEPTLSA